MWYKYVHISILKRVTFLLCILSNDSPTPIKGLTTPGAPAKIQIFGSQFRPNKMESQGGYKLIICGCFFFFFFQRFYLLIHERHRERQRHRQREMQAPCRELDMGLDPGSPGSHTRLQVALNHCTTRAALSRAIYTINQFPTKIPSAFFTELEQVILNSV